MYKGKIFQREFNIVESVELRLNENKNQACFYLPDTPSLANELVTSDVIKEMKLTFSKNESGCSRTDIELKIENKGNTYISDAKQLLEITMELLMYPNFDDEGIIHGDFCFIKLDDSEIIYVVPRDIAFVQSNKKEVLNFSIVKTANVNYDDLQINDFVLYDNDMYVVLQKYMSVKLKTKKSEAIQYKKIKTEPEKMVLIYNVKKFQHLIAIFGTRLKLNKKNLSYYINSIPSSLLGDYGRILNSHTVNKIEGVLTLQPSNDLKNLTHSTIAQDLIQMIVTRKLFSMDLHIKDMTNYFENYVYFSKNDEIYDDNGFITVKESNKDLPSLNKIMKIIQLFEFKDAKTEAVINDIICFDKEKLAMRRREKDMILGQSYQNEKKEVFLFIGEKYEVYPEVTIQNNILSLEYNASPRKVLFFQDKLARITKKHFYENGIFYMVNKSSNEMLKDFINVQAFTDNFDAQTGWEIGKEQLATDGAMLKENGKKLMIEFDSKDKMLLYLGPNAFVYSFDSLEEAESNIYMFTIPSNLQLLLTI